MEDEKFRRLNVFVPVTERSSSQNVFGSTFKAIEHEIKQAHYLLFCKRENLLHKAYPQFFGKSSIKGFWPLFFRK